jgi:hypothetical protein
MNIPKHVIDKKNSMQHIKIFNVKWTLKDKNLQQSFIYMESFNALH